jgi:hypothetical protein
MGIVIYKKEGMPLTSEFPRSILKLICFGESHFGISYYDSVIKYLLLYLYPSTLAGLPASTTSTK